MKTHIHTKTWTQRFTAALFVKAKSWNQHRDPSTGECIPWNTIYIKKEQPTDTHSNLDESLGILMNKKSQPDKVIYSTIPFIEHSQSEKSWEKDRLGVSRVQGPRSRKASKRGYRRGIPRIPEVVLELFRILVVVVDT